MKKVVRLTESDLNRIIKRVIKEQPIDYMSSDLSTAEAIYTMVGAAITLLGFGGSHYIKGMIKKLRSQGKDEQADQVQDALDQHLGGEE